MREQSSLIHENFSQCQRVVLKDFGIEKRVEQHVPVLGGAEDAQLMCSMVCSLHDKLSQHLSKCHNVLDRVKIHCFKMIKMLGPEFLYDILGQLVGCWQLGTPFSHGLFEQC